MHMHDRLGDATDEEANKDIPNKVKHVPAYQVVPSGATQNFAFVQRQYSEGNDEARMTNHGSNKRMTYFDFPCLAPMQSLSEWPNDRKKLHP
jgi:hypothetical protein